MTDAQLDRVIAAVLPTHDSDDTAGFDWCLSQAISRGGQFWQQRLNAYYQQTLHADAKTDRHSPNAKELLLLTALRRVQKKQDPVMVLIEGKATIRTKLGPLPQIRANLTNLDPEKLPISIELGGDYRGASRHNSWRIQVTAANGQTLPELQEFDVGGFLHPTTLEYAESVPAVLELRSYVSIEQPGEYTLVVMFHPTIRIGNETTVDGLVCCQSVPTKLVVEPITIETTAAEQAQVAALILKLPTIGTVKILGGAYRESDGDFMPLNSAAGQLRQMGWKAVPELIRAVNGEKLNPTQRAWALGLLFGITEQRNPTEVPGVLGAFEYRHSGWVSVGGTPGSGASVSRESMSIPESQIDPQAQKAFAKGWQPWIDKGFIKVKKSDATK